MVHGESVLINSRLSITVIVAVSRLLGDARELSQSLLTFSCQRTGKGGRFCAHLNYLQIWELSVSYILIRLLDFRANEILHPITLVENITLYYC